MKRLFSQDSTDDEVDAKKPKHAISESESGDTSHDDEEASKDSETSSEVAEKEVKEYSDLLALLMDPTPKQAVEQVSYGPYNVSERSDSSPSPRPWA